MSKAFFPPTWEENNDYCRTPIRRLQYENPMRIYSVCVRFDVTETYVNTFRFN